MNDINIILKPDSINIENLVIKKKISVSDDLIHYPLKYNNKNLIIQTPIVYLPFGINKYNNKNYIDISITNSKSDKSMNQFKNLIIDVNKHIKKKYKKKRNFMTSFKKTEYFPDRLRLSFYEDILVYNENKTLIDLEHIKSKIYVKLLIIPQFIWETSNTFGISWNILQIKIYSKPLLDTYSFIDDDEVNIDKYVKMLKCGVPAQAVKNKMKLEKLDDSLLDKHINPCSNIPLLPPPLPPPIQIREQKQLKKKSPINKNISGFKITLSDILNIKLKKTKQNDPVLEYPPMHPFVNPDALKKTIRKLNLPEY